MDGRHERTTNACSFINLASTLFLRDPPKQSQRFSGLHHTQSRTLPKPFGRHAQNSAPPWVLEERTRRRSLTADGLAPATAGHKNAGHCLERERK